MEHLLSLEGLSDDYRPVSDDGQADVAGYNKELEQLGNPSWFNVPWLYAECYLYRHVTCSFAVVSIADIRQSYRYFLLPLGTLEVL